MIVLDTNVVSELMRPAPAPEVLAWLDAQNPEQLWLNSVVVAELLVGVWRLADGRRKQALAQAVGDMLEQDFAGRVLPFDVDAASAYAALVTQRERQGRPVAMADAQIAATCLAHGAQLATRNHRHFEELGVRLVNPWQGL